MHIWQEILISCQELKTGRYCIISVLRWSTVNIFSGFCKMVYAVILLFPEAVAELTLTLMLLLQR